MCRRLPPDRVVRVELLWAHLHQWQELWAHRAPVSIQGLHGAGCREPGELLGTGDGDTALLRREVLWLPVADQPLAGQRARGVVPALGWNQCHRRVSSSDKTCRGPALQPAVQKTLLLLHSERSLRLWAGIHRSNEIKWAPGLLREGTRFRR